MELVFTEDQLAFQESVRGFLQKECDPERLRKIWETESGRSPEHWAKLAELGILGMTAPEAHGGLGMNELDLILVLEEIGRAALAAPVIETVAVGVPLLAEVGSPELQSTWIPKIVAGEATLSFGHVDTPFVHDAHIADLLLLQAGSGGPNGSGSGGPNGSGSGGPNGSGSGGQNGSTDGAPALHAIARTDATLTPQPGNDPAGRAFRVDWTPTAENRIADDAARALAKAFDRAALAAAAQQVGIAQQLIDIATQYATQREQFGRPIGSFQAIKHHLASVQVRVEFARPVVYRAAWATAHDTPERAVAVSHAKAAASEAATLAARTALQVHGAIGYTWEVDLHIWMKRAWALDVAWGTRLWHRARIGSAVLGAAPAPSFGFTARA